MAAGKIHLPGLLAALENGDEHVARTARRWRRFLAVAVAVSCLLMVAYLGWVLIELWDAWHSGQWSSFWGALNGVWTLVLVGARFWAVDDPFTGYVDAVHRMQEAAIRGDEQDAPIAQEYSQLSQDSSALFGGVSYGLLERPRDGRGAGLVALIVVALLMAVILGIVLLGVGMSGAGKGAAQAEEIIGGIILILLVVALRLRHGIIVAADEIGVTWKQVGWRTRTRRIAWHDARAFFIVTQRRSTNWAKETTWVLLGPTGALAWMAPREGTAEADTSHARFAALVAARTRLPLRDLSALADRMTSTQLTTEQRDAVSAAMNNATSPQERLEVLRSSLRKSEQESKSSGLGWGCTVQLMLLVVIALVYAGGWGLEQYQPRLYTNMLAQIHTETPLYHDDLTYNDDKWDMELRMPYYDPGHVFKDDGYHLTTTKGYGTHSWTDYQHGDAVVEVTARQIGTGDVDGVGLVLRANANGSDMVVFYVDSAGFWLLYHYHMIDSNPDHTWRFLDGGRSNAIRTGGGAVNRLSVLMRGGQYICYVNGRFVEGYSDDHNETPRYGHMGVYLNDGATEGVFTDFRVYAVPAPSNWWTV